MARESRTSRAFLPSRFPADFAACSASRSQSTARQDSPQSKLFSEESRIFQSLFSLQPRRRLFFRFARYFMLHTSPNTAVRN